MEVEVEVEAVEVVVEEEEGAADISHVGDAVCYIMCMSGYIMLYHAICDISSVAAYGLRYPLL